MAAQHDDAHSEQASLSTSPIGPHNHVQKVADTITATGDNPVL